MSEVFKVRISVNLSDEIVARLDEEAKKLGTSRGSMLTTWIGEKIRQIDTTDEFFREFMKSEAMSKMVDISAEWMKEQKQKGR